MKTTSCFLLIVLTLFLGGCAVVDFGQLTNRLRFWESDSTYYGCNLEPVEDDERLANYQLPEDAIQTNGLLLEISANANEIHRNGNLTATLYNHTERNINIWVPGSFEADSSWSCFAIDEKGNILHEFSESRIYSRDTFDYEELLEGEETSRWISFQRFSSGLGNLNGDDEPPNKPIELVLVAKFEQPEGYGFPAIGPVYSKPKRFRITKFPIVH